MSENEAYELQKSILENKFTDSELLDIFVSLDRSLTDEEFYGLYRASAEAMVKVRVTGDVLDTCGTGGDGLKTFNISTAAAILCSALGVTVAKHGNRSSSSACGSADVLEAMGVRIDLDADAVAQCIETIGFGFMFAQKFHPAFKYAAAARKSFGKRTYFNFLGPLLNPAGAAFRLVGVSDPSMAELMGRTLMRSGAKKVWVVHSRDGMDEISISTMTDVLEFTPGNGTKEFTIDPSDYGVEFSPLSDLVGGDKQRNAKIIKKIFANEGSAAQTGAVVLNAAAGLLVAGRVPNYSDGIETARHGITKKLAAKKLGQIVKQTTSSV